MAAADRLLHPSLVARGPDTVRRARLLVAFALVLVPLVLSDGIDGLRTGSIVRVASAVLFTTTLATMSVALRRWGALEIATHVFCGAITVLVSCIAIFTGVPGPLFGLCGVTLIALFVVGRCGAIWILATIAIALGIAAMRALGFVAAPPLDYSPAAQAVDVAVACAMTSCFAWLFVSSRQRLCDELAEANAVLVREIAERSRAEDRANDANLAKSAFLANMSHEIRTPMTAIMGFGDLLLDESLSAGERTEHVEIIRRNGKHLLGLIDDILDLSKVEAGKMAFERVACSPRRVVADVVSLLRIAAHSKGLSLRVVYATPIPVSIHSDPTRLRQILTNLVSNAVKFTSKGGVVVTVRCADPGGPSPSLSFDVEDSGPGIRPADVGRVFEPFAQADATTTRKFGGTGLGLSISQRLARALGGTLTLASAVGVGSKFTLTVATGSLAGVAMRGGEHEAGPGDALPAKGGPSNLRGRVLLAEDGPDNQALLSSYLKRAGASVTVVADGRAAVEAALDARAQGHAFDLVLMDMQMPELDGYGATRQLRAAGYALPIVALTAHAMSDDRALCLAAGCDDYLTKPVVRDAFGAVLQRYLRGSVHVASIHESTESAA